MKSICRTLLFFMAVSLLIASPFKTYVPTGKSVHAQQSNNGAEIIVAVTTGNNLVSFSTTSPGTLISSVPITGIQSGESVLGIDFRPATGQLFALGSNSLVYIINPATGAATQVGSAAFTPALTGTDFGFDFNPVPDRIRVFSDAAQNLRLNPNTGGVAGTDTNLAYASSDRNSGKKPNAVAAAYSNNVAGTPATTLYAIDSSSDILVRQGDFDGAPISPNTGQLFTVGSLGVDTTGLTGFDIAASDGTGYATLTSPNDLSSGLYRINLATGRASFLGSVGGTELIRDMTIAPHANIYGLTNSNNLVTFDSNNPGVIISQVPITGLQSGENLLGIDFRPATGGLYGLSSASRVYLINKTTGEARQVGSTAFTPALSGTAFGFDFNPVPDRIRVTSNTTQNLRLNPNNGAVAATDGTLAFTAGDKNAGVTPNIVGSAYTNNFNGATATTLYDIDSNLDALVIQNPPNDGKLNTVGPLGVDTSDSVGFDISTVDGSAFAAMTPTGSTVSNLYRINLVTGAATLIGPIGTSDTIRDISVENNLAFMVINIADTPDPVKVGDNITYTISVANFGPNVASAVVVRDALPAGTSFVSATTSQGSTSMATDNNVTTVTASLGALPVRGSATVTIVVKVNSAPSGVITNSATVITGSGDLNQAENTATSLTSITP